MISSNGPSRALWLHSRTYGGKSWLGFQIESSRIAVQAFLHRITNVVNSDNHRLNGLMHEIPLPLKVAVW